jgi:ferredoxin
MNNRIIHIVFFSPTGTTRTVVETIARGTGCAPGTIVDLTTGPVTEHRFTDTDLIILGMPVYSGRIPSLAVDRFKSILGSHTPVVPVVVYGNRHFDDSLAELSDISQSQGFYPIAACAFIGEHSFSTSDLPLSAGRPDAADLEKAEAFGKRIQISKLALENIPGNRPYKAATEPMGCATSVTADLCTMCERCVAVCPTGGIHMTASAAMPDPENCIWCMACERICPSNAHKLTNEKIKASAQKLNQFFSERREPETFVATESLPG